MLARKGLGALKLTLGDSLTNFEDSMKDMGSTYRMEGLSLNETDFRLFNKELEMQVTYSDLIIGKRIGQGACSAVHLAEHEKTGVMYAVKMFNVFDKGQRSQMTKEIKILTELDCEAIVAYSGAWYSEGRIGIILEYMDRGSIEFLEDENIRLDEQTIAGIIFQILWGLGYLHFEKHLHRDVKPGNILLNSNGQVKVSDFGISTALENTLSSGSIVGSYRYMSPERLRGEKYGISSDIWSVGVVLVQLWTKIYPFHYACSTPIELLGELRELDISQYLKELQFPESMHNFIMCMMAPNADERFCAEELCAHAWFLSNGITNLEEAQAVVRTWLVDQGDDDGMATKREESHGELSSSLSSSHMSSRHGVRAYRSNRDLMLSDTNNFDHPLLSHSLSRANSISKGTDSNSNSIKTELSDNNNISSRNSSYNNLYSGLGAGSNGPSPDQNQLQSSLEGSPSYDKLNSMLPTQKSNFNSSNRASGSIDDMPVEDIDLALATREHAIETDNSDFGEDGDVDIGMVFGTTDLLKNMKIGGNKRERTIGSTLDSTDSSAISLNTTTKTQSTANFTTGTGYSDLNLSIVDEDENDDGDSIEEDYLKEEFETNEYDNSLDDVADEVVADGYYDDDDALPRRPRLRRPPSTEMEAKESFYRSHK
jgi:serine/threonine protein kinase